MPANTNPPPSVREATLPPEGVRVCIVAENASLQFGGEASLPLHYFSRLRARNQEAWIIIHDRTRRELEALFPDDQDRIQYIIDRWDHKLLTALIHFFSGRIGDALFGNMMVLINQMTQRHMIKRMIRDHRINIVHQPTPVSPKAPSFIFGLGIPVVIGPMNGGMEYPSAFRGHESIFVRAVHALGRATSDLVNRVIAGKIYARTLLVANERTRLALPSGIRGNVIMLPENGVDLTIWTPPNDPVPTALLARFVFVGRLIDWKRLDIVLHALAGVPDARLDVIGDGPMRSAWSATAERLGIADRVRWLGWLPQRECAKHLQRAAALLLPSIYECGGAVVLEAMACAIPVVATAWGGPADYVDETCGILIEPFNEESVIKGFRNAMQKLATDHALRSTLGAAARKRVELLFDWNKKIDRMLDIYQR